MRVFIVGALSLLLGCGADTNNSSIPATAPETTSGIDLSAMDTAVRPQDDFFAYANGGWLQRTEIPEDKSSWGSFHIVHEKSLKQLRTIVQEVSALEAGNSATAKIAAFYRAWLNEKEIEERALRPIIAEWNAIDQARSRQDIISLFALFNSIGVDSPINFWVDQDARESTRYIVYLTQSGLGLPDRDYYFDSSERGQNILTAYQSYIATILGLAGSPDPEAAAARVLALETRLANHHWTKIDNRDSEKTYNKHSASATATLLGDYGFAQFTGLVGIGEQDAYIVRQPSYFAALGKLTTAVELASWQDYLRLNLLTSFAPYLPKRFENAHFEFYNRTLSGQPAQQARWKLAINSLNENVGELLGQLYVAKYFPPEAKQRMTALVDNLIEAYRASINNLDWMGDATRQKALAKLDQFTPKIGYPDKWKDYSTLIVNETDLVGNIKRARMFNHNLQVDKLGKPVDRSEWFMAPQRVNAYYNPGMNEIVFPAAILQPPFFNLNADDAINYGGIGGVIGHEIGHGFDDQGSKYNGEGNLQNWWTDADRRHFEGRTRRLVEQYGQYEPLPGLPINGELTLGENIGDLGGLSIAHDAYLRSLADKPAPVLDGYTGEQRVFLGWAQVWRVKRRPELSERLIKTDPHSPPRYRVNGVVSNIDSFYKAFDIGPRDQLYLAPEQRVKIW